MLSHRGQLCTLRVSLGGVIMLSFMLLFNLSTSLAQSCLGDVQDVWLIGLTINHLVVITGESEGSCSYYLPTDSLDTENMQIHLKDGLLLSERWPKFYEKFDKSPHVRFTVRDVSGRNIIFVEKYVYDIDKDTLEEVASFGLSTIKSSISSTENMKYYAIDDMEMNFSGIKAISSNVIFAYTISGSVIYQAKEETHRGIAFMCSDFDNENIYLHKAWNYSDESVVYSDGCLTCKETLNWKDYGPSGFTSGDLFYFFSTGLVHIVFTGELEKLFPEIKPGQLAACLTDGIKASVLSMEMNAFFTKAPPAPTSPATLNTSKRIWSTLPYNGPNSKPAKSGSSSSRTGLIIGIVLIVILFVGAVCVCGCCCYKKKKKQPKNADKNTKTDAGRGRIKTRGRSAEKLGANSRGKQGHKASSLKRSSLASVRKASSRKNLSSKRATSLAVASKKTGKPSSMRNDNLATSRQGSSRQASSLRPSSRKNLSSKRVTSLAVASKKTGKASSMRNDNLATSRQASSRRASSHKNLSSKRVSTQAVTSRRTGRSAGTKQSLASRK